MHTIQAIQSKMTGTGELRQFIPSVIDQNVFVGNQQGFRLGFDPKDNVFLLRPAINHAPDDFKKHEKKWKQDTKFMSSLADKYLHPSYARIIGLGWPAVSFILKSLQRQPDDWFYALRAITGENPVPMSVAGNMPKMAEIWIDWGKKHNLI